jgi:hypothetical protein
MGHEPAIRTREYHIYGASQVAREYHTSGPPVCVSAIHTQREHHKRLSASSKSTHNAWESTRRYEGAFDCESTKFVARAK